MEKAKNFILFFVATYQKWLDDRAMRMAAALSYYGMFSLAPLLVIITGLVGALVERFAGDLLIETDITSVLSGVVGSDVAEFIAELVEGTVESTTFTSSLPLASLIGFGVMLWGASSIFKYLHEVLNTIWGVKPVPKGGIWITIRRYAVSFVVVFVCGLFLILFILLNIIVSTVLPVIEEIIPNSLDVLPDIVSLQIAQFGVLLAMTTLLFAAFYKILPDVDIRWRDVFVGAAFTAALFSVGIFVLGIYFSFYSSSLYGAAGALVVILLWFYFSAQLFLFGAEFTYMYATRYGSQIKPADYIEEEESEDDQNPSEPASKAESMATEGSPGETG